jgi:hypothetical protein
MFGCCSSNVYFCRLKLLWWYGSQDITRMQKFVAKRCVVIGGHSFFPGGKKHESGCCLCVSGSRANGVSCC